MLLESAAARGIIAKYDIHHCCSRKKMQSYMDKVLTHFHKKFDLHHF
jgi:hypothetical protein